MELSEKGSYEASFLSNLQYNKLNRCSTDWRLIAKKCHWLWLLVNDISPWQDRSVNVDKTIDAKNPSDKQLADVTLHAEQDPWLQDAQKTKQPNN